MTPFNHMLLVPTVSMYIDPNSILSNVLLSSPKSDGSGRSSIDHVLKQLAISGGYMEIRLLFCFSWHMHQLFAHFTLLISFNFLVHQIPELFRKFLEFHRLHSRPSSRKAWQQWQLFCTNPFLCYIHMRENKSER